MGAGKSRSVSAMHYVPVTPMTKEDVLPYGVFEMSEGSDPKELYNEVKSALRDLSFVEGDMSYETFKEIAKELGLETSYTDYLNNGPSAIRQSYVQQLEDMGTGTINDGSTFSRFIADQSTRQKLLITMDSVYRMSELTGIKPDLYVIFKGSPGFDAMVTPRRALSDKKTATAEPPQHSQFLQTIAVATDALGGKKSATGWAVSTVLKNYSQSDIVHEFGHLVLSKLLDNSHTRNKVLEYANKVKSEVSLTVYGNRDHNEAFAENFSAYVFGVTKPVRGGVQYREFQNLMRDTGNSHLFNSYGTSTKSGIQKIVDYNRSKITPTRPTPQSTSKPTLRTPTTGIAKTITATVGGKSFTIDFTPAMIKRGFANKFVNGKQYRITPDGNVFEVT